VFVLRRVGSCLCRTARATAAVGAVAMLAAAAGPGTTALSGTVTSGPARSLGEPAAAQDTAVSAVVATTFGSAGAQVSAWTRRADAGSWIPAGPVLPAGFGSSYDASAAAVPNGPVLVVAGTSPPGESCITSGSVAIAKVYATGRLGPAQLVSDQRGTGRFDDRPVVAAGPDGTVWVAWSQGTDADACQNVGQDDQIEVAVSHDGGRTFGAPVALPLGAGRAAFGARLTPLAGGQVAVSWTETMSDDGDEAVFVSVLPPDGQPGRPQAVLTGDPLPLALPGASFYDFPAGDVTALPSGRLVVAAPLWRSGRSVIALAVGLPGGPWQYSTVTPPDVPGGADLLLPALGVLSPVSVRLVCAVHVRSGDHLGYDWTDLSLSGPLIPSGALVPLTAAPAGPGFFEIGEELEVSATPTGLLSSMVVAGAGGATLETKSWPVASPAVRSPSASPGRPASASPAARASVPSRSDSSAPVSPWPWAAGIVVGSAVLIVLWRLRRTRHG
jgi:hypothetical protein